MVVLDATPSALALAKLVSSLSLLFFPLLFSQATYEREAHARAAAEEAMACGAQEAMLKLRQSHSSWVKRHCADSAAALEDLKQQVSQGREASRAVAAERVKLREANLATVAEREKVAELELWRAEQEARAVMTAVETEQEISGVVKRLAVARMRAACTTWHQRELGRCWRKWAVFNVTVAFDAAQQLERDNGVQPLDNYNMQLLRQRQQFVGLLAAASGQSKSLLKKEKQARRRMVALKDRANQSLTQQKTTFRSAMMQAKNTVTAINQRSIKEQKARGPPPS